MTTVARTIVDLAEIETVERLTNVMYEAAYRGLLDLDELRAGAARLNGRHKLAVLEEAIEAHLKGSAGSKSEKEDAFHALGRGRFPKAIANVKVLGHEVDAYWPEFKLIAEVDGAPSRAPAGEAPGPARATASSGPPATRCCASPTSRSSSGPRTWSRRFRPR